MVKCQACHSLKHKKIWEGNARIGKIGNLSNSMSKCYRCNKCKSITSIQSSIYKENYFRNGHYRRSVDGKKSISINDYFINHYKETLQYLDNIEKDYIIGKKVLDFGSGAGSFLRFLSPFIKTGIGIELDENFHFKKNNIINLKSFKESDEVCKKFDLITSYSVFGQLIDSRKILNKLVSRLKSNGILIIADVNANDYLLTEGNKKYKDQIFFRESYQNYYTKKGLIAMCKKNNLSLLSSRFIQRYDYSNALKYITKEKIEKKIDILSSKKYIRKYYQKFLEIEEISDYMMLTFKKNN